MISVIVIALIVACLCNKMFVFAGMLGVILIIWKLTESRTKYLCYILLAVLTGGLVLGYFQKIETWGFSLLTILMLAVSIYIARKASKATGFSESFSKKGIEFKKIMQKECASEEVDINQWVSQRIADYMD